ncbi:hypothetical protein Kpol_1049p17 [Vanderwaltozyma polyspora DSM 70294]|uniref:Uncharacterized protein n=1 Tax=Vanderwaltozyma polyspora (strain ATCC 22028 / DSM 70294 / BCRC 21397 / CBS 2163 / NBRC 10782 / NRRL Y-8283 / UCD 57-17) TaxID=436907 RepID=A7TPQ7_VANPO|nr:uncharacterized protein Kpol_1049p17 [Vanderwaltozyma polyspora DSM 70294]EDO15759.1 hypothetical protein Kpol_1049p17 [Vanderwaltozyma polyspora DSM 70294]
MARKVTKNSRAARRGLTEVFEPEANSLSELPRAQKTDLTNILVRTAAKNEALLDAKIGKKRAKKSGINKKALELKLTETETLIEKQKLQRALNITNRLDGKIAKSVARAKYVQKARKAGWETTNQLIRNELTINNDEVKATTKEKTEDNTSTVEAMEEHVETYGDVEGYDDLEEDNDKSVPKTKNMFELLNDDIEQ